MSKHENLKQFEIETAVVKVLRRAREMVAAGWCQNMTSIVEDDRHDRCAGQAMIDAACETAQPRWCRYAMLLDEANRLFITAIGTLNNNIPEWNDNKHRTKEDVLAAFDKAIRIAS